MEETGSSLYQYMTGEQSFPFTFAYLLIQLHMSVIDIHFLHTGALRQSFIDVYQTKIYQKDTLLAFIWPIKAYGHV